MGHEVVMLCFKWLLEDWRRVIMHTLHWCILKQNGGSIVMALPVFYRQICIKVYSIHTHLKVLDPISV